MSEFGVIAFDGLFPVKVTPLAVGDRMFGYDSEGNVNAAFTITWLKAAFGGGDWNFMDNKPEKFPAEAHTLGSHSNTEGLDGAADGKIIGRVAGKWASVTPPWALPGDIPNVPVWVLEITATMMENWEAAYGWGDHASVGYLTEEDIPDVPAWVLGISETEKANWNTAFGWGNHADAGYIVTESDPVFTASPAAGISLGNISVWNNKTLEYAGFADGDTPMILNGEAKISGLTAQLTENPFDPETEEEDYLAWVPEVTSFTFPKVVKGVPAVEDDEFVTKGQLGASTSGSFYEIDSTWDTINPSTKKYINVVLNYSTVITLEGPLDPLVPFENTYRVKQTVGGNTLTWDGIPIVWQGGSEPVIETGLNAVNYVHVIWDGTNLYGYVRTGFVAPTVIIPPSIEVSDYEPEYIRISPESEFWHPTYDVLDVEEFDSSLYVLEFQWAAAVASPSLPSEGDWSDSLSYALTDYGGFPLFRTDPEYWNEPYAAFYPAIHTVPTTWVIPVRARLRFIESGVAADWHVHYFEILTFY